MTGSSLCTMPSKRRDFPVSLAGHYCFKTFFNRPKDWVDFEAMLRQAPLDWEYVHKWLLHLHGENAWPKPQRLLRLCEGLEPGDCGMDVPDLEDDVR